MSHRRQAVSFDAYYFEKAATEGRVYAMQDTFEHIADTNLWGSPESTSGVGSSHLETNALKAYLQNLLHTYQIKTLIDAPCGDCHWIRTLDLSHIQYIGVDILRTLITHHQQKNISPNVQFLHLDVTNDQVPKGDLILCRDALVHFSYADIFKTLTHFKNSGATYLLTTTFTETDKNEDIVTGDWRPINLQRAPFNFSAPIAVFEEGCLQNEGLYKDKSLGLWRLSEI